MISLVRQIGHWKAEISTLFNPLMVPAYQSLERKMRDSCGRCKGQSQTLRMNDPTQP
jgi:hypothetical protein